MQIAGKEPCWGKSRLGKIKFFDVGPKHAEIHGGVTGRFTKQATTFPVERNKPSAVTKARALHRVLMGENPILQNTIGGGQELGVGKGKTAAPTAGKQQGAGGGIQDGQH